MWVFSKSGFVSIVAHRNKPGFVMVRGRKQEDVENFRDACESLLPLEVVHTPEADYICRVTMPALTAMTGMVSLMVGIDYYNFKDAVHERDEPTRDRAMMRVWRAMHDYQEATRPDGPENEDMVADAMDEMDRWPLFWER